jgi:hypothetical protein
VRRCPGRLPGVAPIGVSEGLVVPQPTCADELTLDIHNLTPLDEQPVDQLCGDAAHYACAFNKTGLVTQQFARILMY